jgi:hypothetical protein
MDVAHAFRLQSAACKHMGSDLCARLLDVATADLEREGPTYEVVDHWDRNAMDDAVPLRLLGGVHRLVLSGRAPELAQHYPTAGGVPRWPACGDAFLATVAQHVPELRAGMLHPPQTNEVGRAGVLLGGLLEISRITELPLRLLEFGASAGLNLRLDAYRYDFDVATWGDADSPVVVRTPWRGRPPDTARMVNICERCGCDAAPVDVGDDEQALRLASFVWPDQTERFDRTQRAIDLVRLNPVRLGQESADTWLARQLEAPADGVVTVIMHSAVMQYLGKDLRARVNAIIRERAQHASPQAPLARLAFEPGRKYFALRLHLWPHDIDLVLADAHPHGAWAEWHVGSRA